MFIKKTVRRRGDKRYEYLSLVEAVREDGKNTHRTLARLGEVSELRASGQLDRITKVPSQLRRRELVRGRRALRRGRAEPRWCRRLLHVHSLSRPRGTPRRRRQDPPLCVALGGRLRDAGQPPG